MKGLESISSWTATAGAVAARRRLAERHGDPLFVADWKRALFLHYAVEAGALQAEVPFELDLWEGREAIVTLVAFTMEGMRPFVGGKWTKWLLAPISTHGFLNARTYVRHGKESGIFFLREWLSNRIAVHLGPWSFGLPYRYGEIDYHHEPGPGERMLYGEVRGRGRSLRYRGRIGTEPVSVVVPGTREEFLLERYTAFTCPGPGNPRRVFEVWHEPWRQAAVEVQIEDDSLLRGLGSWAEGAHLLGANYSAGVEGVWMGRPQRVRGI